MRSILVTLLVLVVVPAFGRNVIVTENAVRLDNVVWCEEEETVEVSSLPVTRGLVAYWDFDSSNAVDSIGGYDATNYVYGASITYPEGGVGNGTGDGNYMYFNKQVNQQVGWTSYQAAGQNTIYLSNTFTIGWWQRAQDVDLGLKQGFGIPVGGYRTQSGTSEAQDGDFYLIFGIVNTNWWQFAGRMWVGGVAHNVVDYRAPLPYSVPIYGDYWHSLTVTYDGASLTTYINGVSNSVARTIPAFEMNHLGGSVDADFHGLEQVRVHDVCLTPEEIAECEAGFQ